MTNEQEDWRKWLEVANEVRNEFRATLEEKIYDLTPEQRLILMFSNPFATEFIASRYYEEVIESGIYEAFEELNDPAWQKKLIEGWVEFSKAGGEDWDIQVLIRAMVVECCMDPALLHDIQDRQLLHTLFLPLLSDDFDLCEAGIKVFLKGYKDIQLEDFDTLLEYEITKEAEEFLIVKRALLENQMLKAKVGTIEEDKKINDAL